ncbi:DedA family protein [invertebrate metagenome]|uniref:DedA family protein n=1 Tax=invertebrate metagenome TaxID=1711999 RepID=A0A484H6T8_9ZZZZ
MRGLLDTFLDTFSDLETFLHTYGYFSILLLTFLEGETIVILAGIAAAQELMSPFLVVLAGFTGSFLGDQLYYTIGRRYGQPLLESKPFLRPKIEWAFRLVRQYQDLYILSFRFLYGVRNVSPFVIAISGVTRWRFMLLNALSALVWAIIFTSGGYFFGHAMEHLLGKYYGLVLPFLVCIACVAGVIVMMYRRLKWRKKSK